MAQLDGEAITQLQRAAEEVAWLVGRGYPAARVSPFVAEQHELTETQKATLAAQARLTACVRHHIARELDPEDVSRRPLRVDATNVVNVVAAALRGDMLLESPGGVLAEPSTERRPWLADEAQTEAVQRCAKALAPLRAKSVQLLVDGSVAGASDLAAALSAAVKASKLKKAEVEVVEAPTKTLTGGAFVVSSDPAVLDGCATWLNLPPLALAGASFEPLRLE